MSDYQLPEGKSLVLRSNEPNLVSYNNFQWPESGPVSCPDWQPTAECGKGLHGWLWAMGDYGLMCRNPKAKWLVVEVDTDSLVNLDGKVKFPSGNVILCATYREAYDLVMKWYWLREAKNVASTSGRYAPASTSGESAPASTSGRYAPASTSGEYAPASTSGESAPASTSGESAPASTSGRYAPASTSGENATACCLNTGGKAKCGAGGAVILTRWDGNRYRHIVGYAGENGIEDGKWYTVNDKNELIETTQP